ncbi:PAS domain S-box protein [Pseudodesulfovibrio sp. zrk46]|uniref:PAS domain S-box protein n=1 Tax=Pseudodesulfovibrio sp. zrk46 TaxID=2725288 RepID=UPI001448BC84|nr:PAS domain S-box protein [Pseudodesulfovibrio sp. zrk46]QJB56217.1 PAS domain S-box protein [Pseudodesulfovibrio sp. zrk46]
MPKTIREFLKLFGPLALGILVVSTWFIYNRNQSHLEVAGSRQKTLVGIVATTVERGMVRHAHDASFLARLVARHLEEDPSYVHIEEAFSDFARSRSDYFVIRYIDNSGDEQVRVDKSYAGPVISPRDKLQHKGGRYYFQETMRAGKNDVYISRFDLNIEHDQIEEPLRPTLRFGSPVFDSDGKRMGIVVINYEGSMLLDQLSMHANKADGSVMLCNGEGYWMLGPSKEDEWGHMLGDDDGPSMAKRYPAAWRVIQANDKTQLTNEYGLFTSATVNIIPGVILIGDSPPNIPDTKRWKIVTLVAPDLLVVPWKDLYITLVSLCLFFLALGCWYLADNRVHQAEVEAWLRENEERTMAISDSSQDAIIMIDAKGLITHWNPAAKRLFGYSEDEALGRDAHELLAPEMYRERVVKGLWKFSKDGSGHVVGKVLELEGVRKDGSIVPVELAISSFQFKGEWYAVGALRDATARKQAELELKRSEETSRALLNAPTESAMLIQPGGTIVAINEVGAFRLGGNVEEITGKNIFDLVEPELANTRRGHIRQVLQTGEGVTFEDMRRGRRMLINAYPVKNPDGSVDKVALFARDVTEQRQAEAALLHSEQRFRDVSAAVGEYIWETDAQGVFKFLTEDVVAVLGYTAEELLGRDPEALLPSEDVEDYHRWYEDLAARHGSFSNVEVRNVTKDGTVIWLQVNGVPYFGEDEEFLGYRGAAMNITDRKQAEVALKENERKLRALAESAYDAIITVDDQGLITFWNDSAEMMFGYTEEEALGQNVNTLILTPEDREGSEASMDTFARTGDGPAMDAIVETQGMRKDGSSFPMERSTSSFRLGGRWYAVATIRDITERKRTEAKLRELATTDSLTGLFNRRRFMELSEREFSRSSRYGRSLAMLMLDIDHFKNVNDTYGHDVGDQVLRSLSEIAIMALRKADILGRLGGEEFGVLLPETDLPAAQEVAERLRVSIERNVINTSAGPLNITVSIGVGIFNDATVNTQELLKRADIALYEAKQSGRNRVVVG